MMLHLEHLSFLVCTLLYWEFAGWAYLLSMFATVMGGAALFIMVADWRKGRRPEWIPLLKAVYLFLAGVLLQAALWAAWLRVPAILPLILA